MGKPLSKRLGSFQGRGEGEEERRSQDCHASTGRQEDVTLITLTRVSRHQLIWRQGFQRAVEVAGAMATLGSEPIGRLSRCSHELQVAMTQTLTVWHTAARGRHKLG